MTAKSKRPFYVFAAVALLCIMVLVAGVRGSRADDGQSPLLAGPRVLDSAPTLTPFPAAPGTLSPDGVPSATGGSGPGATGEPAPTIPDLGRPPVASDPEGGGLSAPESGVATLPPLDLTGPPASDPGATPPVEDEGAHHGKGRGHDKGKGKDKDGQGQGTPPGTESVPGPESEPEAESQAEVVEPETELDD